MRVTLWSHAQYGPISRGLLLLLLLLPLLLENDKPGRSLGFNGNAIETEFIQARTAEIIFQTLIWCNTIRTVAYACFRSRRGE